MIGLCLALLRVSVLSFALGLYLPLSLTTATMVGALVRSYVNYKTSDESAQERGILLASGLIGGDACIGIIIALLTVLQILPVDADPFLPNWVSLATFLCLGGIVGLLALRKNR
jgi:uncharacterized oligopeptide transporter (OPT) family protein